MPDRQPTREKLGGKRAALLPPCNKQSSMSRRKNTTLLLRVSTVLLRQHTTEARTQKVIMKYQHWQEAVPIGQLRVSLLLQQKENQSHVAVGHAEI